MKLRTVATTLVSVAVVTSLGCSRRSFEGSQGPHGFYVLDTPCRLVDTRGNGAPIAPGRLSTPQVTQLRVRGKCQIPTKATAVFANVTAISPTGAGFLYLTPFGLPAPSSPISNLNFSAGALATGNSALALLGPAGAGNDLTLVHFVAGNGSVDVTLDVFGYLAE